MKTIIAGSRTIDGAEGFHAVKAAIKASKFAITEVVCGEAHGPDSLGKTWAHGHGIPVKRMPAKWRDEDGNLDRQAGFKRNAEMAEYADALIAVWDGQSRGTRDMIYKADQLRLELSVTYVLDVKTFPNDRWGVDEYVLHFDDDYHPASGNRFLVTPLG